MMVVFKTYEVEVIDGDIYIYMYLQKEASPGFLLNKIDEVRI